MKSDSLVTGAVAGVLAFLASLGSVGCLVSGFSLPVQDEVLLLLGCLLPAAAGALAFSRKGGGMVLLLLWIPVCVWLWRQDTLPEITLSLISRISAVYDSAYGWGAIPFSGEAPQSYHLPLSLLAAGIGLTVARTVCRGAPVFPALVLSLLPLCLCLVVTDTVPDVKFLFCLFFSLLLLLLTGHVRRGSPYQGNRLTFLAALPTALALCLLLIAVPQEGYVNRASLYRDQLARWFQELPRETVVFTPEMTITLSPRESEQLALDTLGQRNPSDTPVMWVTGESDGVLYLRGQDYDVYDGTSWQSSSHRVEPFVYEGVDLGAVTIQTENPLGLLYLPYYPQGEQRLVEGHLENSRLSTGYTFTRLGLPGNWRELTQRGSREFPEHLQAYLELPEQTRSQAQSLLPDLSHTQSVTEQADAIGAVVEASARYDLNTAPMPSDGRDFALWFLTQGETGYCVHFATASVVLLRAAGIPARDVSGYMLRIESGQTAAVTEENAPGWAEYYEPALKTWVLLESTPGASAGEESPAAPTAPETQPTRETTQPTRTPTQPETFPTGSPGETEPLTVPQTAPRELGAVFLLPLLLLAAAAGAEGQRRLRLALRRRRQTRGSPNAQALALWQEAERLARIRKEPVPEELEQLAGKAKFSQHTLTREELGAFEQHLRRQRRLLSRQSWYRQLLYRYWHALY